MERCWFAGKRCLDVGCNEGLVSLALASRSGAAAMLGLDIDADLVQRACANLSRQAIRRWLWIAFELSRTCPLLKFWFGVRLQAGAEKGRFVTFSSSDRRRTAGRCAAQHGDKGAMPWTLQGAG